MGAKVSFLKQLTIKKSDSCCSIRPVLSIYTSGKCHLCIRDRKIFVTGIEFSLLIEIRPAGL